MNLQLIESKVIDLQFSKAADVDSDKINFSLDLGVGFPDDPDDCDHFAVTFLSEFQIKENYIFKVQYRAIFETDKPINEEFKSGHFPRVNAPAIAFPFFRTFVATFLLNAGFEPIILPSINFMKLKEEKIDRKD